MEERANPSVAFSHMTVLAALSAVALVVVILWQIGHSLSRPAVTAGNELAISGTAETPFSSVDWQASDPDTANAGDKDGLSNIGTNVVAALFGSYAALQNGAYSPADAEKVAMDIGSSLKANINSPTYTERDLTTSSETSYSGMLAYREAMRLALEPLLKNPGYELKIFSTYLETKDTKYLSQLHGAAENYRAAVKNALAVRVPLDAVGPHVAAVNALSAFGELTAQLALHADDPFASAALLRTYTGAEHDLVASFDSLATYQKSKTP